ncbi:MAG: hypothetical protein ABIJ56_08455 [Pseudomonadota bacterium]
MIRRLRGLLQKPHKYTALHDYYEKQGPEAFEQFLYRLIRDDRRGLKGDHGDILMIVAELAVDLPEESRGDLCAIACEKKHFETVNFFSSPRFTMPHEAKVGDVIKSKGGKPFSLGERKSLARNPGRHLLTRLLHDPDPDVIRNLLKSPKITEKDVIRIASLRPVSQEVLATVFKSRKWMSSYRVRVTLLSNPYLKPEYGLKLVPSLLMQDLKMLENDNLIHPEIRNAIRQIVSGDSTQSELDRKADDALTSIQPDDAPADPDDEPAGERQDDGADKADEPAS